MADQPCPPAADRRPADREHAAEHEREVDGDHAAGGEPDGEPERDAAARGVDEHPGADRERDDRERPEDPVRGDVRLHHRQRGADDEQREAKRSHGSPLHRWYSRDGPGSTR